MDGNAIPIVEIGLLGFDQFEFLFGVIDQRAELFLLGLTDRVAEKLVHLTLDISRGILQHMLEGFTLTVQVGQEMLCTLGQIHDCLEVDNLFGCIGNGGKRL